MEQPSELSTLLRLAAKGDPDAFSSFVKQTEKTVYRYAYSVLGNREDAEDLTQETYLRLWKSLMTYRGDASPLTYLLRIARNLTADQFRHRRSHPVPDSLTPGENVSMISREPADADPENNPAEAYQRKEIAATVRNALAKLPEEQRVILTLRDMDGRSYEEISDLLHLHPGTVKSRISRARNVLRILLQNKNF